MSILGTRKVNAGLGAQLAAKGKDLRTEQVGQARLQDQYVAAAANAYDKSVTAEKHAAAVEQALSVLVDAGVPL